MEGDSRVYQMMVAERGMNNLDEESRVIGSWFQR